MEVNTRDKIKVMIVEDEVITSQSIRVILIELGYEVTGIATDIREAENLLKLQIPDISLIDIQLSCGDDGITLAKSIKSQYNLPVIFITSHSDKSTVERAKEANPDGYLVKPFDKEDLFTSIEIALSNFLKSNATETEKEDNNFFFNEYIFIKRKYQFEKVRIHDIQWIKSEGNYLEMNCDDKKRYIIRSTFPELFENIPSKIFVQVHKSYAVNIESIDYVRPNEIVINDSVIPIGKKYQENIKKKLKLIY